MAIRSGFFNSISGDRVYNASNFAEYFATFIGNGVFAQPSNSLQVTAGTNLSVLVRAGKGWINGYYLVNDANHEMYLDPADSTLNRVDRIVLRLDLAARSIIIGVKRGTPSSSPTPPNLQRDASYYDLALADILIPAGATQMLQSNITDQRFNTSLCGVVKGLIDQVDTTNLFAQYNTAFNNWFSTITNILNSNAAGNLQTQITAIDTRLKKLDFNTAAQTIYFSPTGVDTNTGLTASVPKKNIQTFINSLPKNLNKKVQLRLLQGNYSDQGQIKISDFRGSGDLEITGDTSNRALYSLNSVVVEGCMNVVIIANVTLITTSPTTAMVFADKSFLVQASNITGTGESVTGYGVRTSAAKMFVSDSALFNKRYGIFAENFSEIFAINNSGQHYEIGLFATTGSTIVKSGTNPGGNNAAEYSTLGGLIR